MNKEELEDLLASLAALETRISEEAHNIREANLWAQRAQERSEITKQAIQIVLAKVKKHYNAIVD